MPTEPGPRDISADRVRLTPEEELAMMERRLQLAADDEEKTAFSPDHPPKAPHPREEAVTDVDGEQVIDLQDDTFTVDPLTTFDLDTGDVDVDPF